MASVEDVESERKEVQALAEWRLVSCALGVLPLNEFSTFLNWEAKEAPSAGPLSC